MTDEEIKNALLHTAAREPVVFENARAGDARGRQLVASMTMKWLAERAGFTSAYEAHAELGIDPPRVLAVLEKL